MYAYVISISITLLILISSPVQAQDSGEMIKNLFGTMLQGAIRKQQDKQFRKNWQLCFERNLIDACDKALSYPHLQVKYRKTILNHRNKILGGTQNFEEQIDPSAEFNNKKIALETQLSQERQLRSELQQQLSDAHRQAQNLKRSLQQEQLDQRDLKQHLQTTEIKLAAFQKLVGEFDQKQSQLQDEIQTLKFTLKRTEQSKTQQQKVFTGILIATSLLALVLIIMVFRRSNKSQKIPVEQKPSEDFTEVLSEPKLAPKSLDEKETSPSLKPPTFPITGDLIHDVRQALHG